MVQEIASGDVVVSTAGRDKGKAYLVLGVKDGFVYLVDGKSRLPVNPKKKSPKHIKVVSPQGLKTMADEIKNGNLVGAKRIKNALAKQKNIGG